VLVVSGGVFSLLAESNCVEICPPEDVVLVNENSQTSFVVQLRSNCKTDSEIAMAMTSCSCVAKPVFPVRLRSGSTEKLEFSIASGESNPDEISSVRIRFFGHCGGKSFTSTAFVRYKVIRDSFLEGKLK
jgi:hypothetical protein